MIKSRNTGLTTLNLTGIDGKGLTGFPMQETPNVSATGTSSDIVRSFVGTTLLTFTFFSNENVDKIQNMIRYLVHKYTSQIVGPQDYTELLVIMRSMYL